MSFLRELLERRSLIVDPSLDPTRIPAPSEGWSSWTGVAVNEMTALQHLTVWACVSLISDVGAMLPFGAFRKVDDARMPVTPDPQLLREPNAEMDVTEFLGRLFVSVLLRGNAYGLVTSRDPRTLLPTQIMPLHPDECEPRRDTSGAIVYKLAGEKTLRASNDVLHVRGMTLPGSRNLKGLSPILYARQTIGLGLGAAEFGARFFAEGGVPAGYLTTDGKMTDEDAQKMADRWVQRHGSRSRKPAVLSGGLKYETVSINPEESQFLATRDSTRTDICGFYRVPPHMVSNVAPTTSWGSGIEEQSLGFVTFTMGIWLTRFERAFTRLLPKPQYARFNVAALLRGRTLDRFNAYLIGRQGGWLSVNDILALEERPGIGPDGDTYDQPLNHWGAQPGQAANTPGAAAGSALPADAPARMARILEAMEARMAAA